MKNYPKLDVLGFDFGMGKSTADAYVKKLTPVLLLAQKRLEVLPRSEIKSPEELAQLAGGQRILADITERPHYRHKDYEDQKKHYSGKQKDHTLKNAVIALTCKKILYVGNTVPGSIHDYKLFKEEFSTEKDRFSQVMIMVDLGFQGIKKDYMSEHNIFIPHKKPGKSKNNPSPKLTDKQKEENKSVSKDRIYVEHAIGGMKRFEIPVARLRNKLQFFKDVFIRLAAGLFNLKNNFVIQ